MQALKEEEQMNRDLKEYIGQILTRILDSNPGLLEIKPGRTRHGSTASATSTGSSCTWHQGNTEILSKNDLWKVNCFVIVNVPLLWWKCS